MGSGSSFFTDMGTWCPTGPTRPTGPTGLTGPTSSRGGLILGGLMGRMGGRPGSGCLAGDRPGSGSTSSSSGSAMSSSSLISMIKKHETWF